MTNRILRGCISGSTLKWLAVIAMFINHFGDTMIKGVIMNAPYSAFSDAQFSLISNCYSTFHAIGRISMPIFAFLIVEGFIHTHNLKKYLLRLGLFSIISEIPYDLAFGKSIFDLAQQNVFFTLTAGLFALIVIEKYRENKLAASLIIVLIVSLAYLLKFDGSYYGILMIILFFLFKDRRLIKCISILILQISIMLVFQEPFGLNAVFAAIPLLFICLYNGKRGMNLKYFFYIFYPAHLLIFALLTRLIIIPLYS